MDKVVAITGASSGIGRAAALHLADRGAKLVLAARGEDRLRAVIDEIEAAGGDAVPVSVDVASRADMERLVATALDRHGRLDVLVSGAGTMPVGPVEELAVDDWDRMVDVNLKGVLYGVAAALPVFQRQERGHFINIASTAARKTTPNQTIYSATKAAVLAFSDGLRQELAGSIRVTVVSPGFTATNGLEQVRDAKLRAQMEEAAERFAMDPTAVAQAVAYAIDQPDGVNVGEIVIRSTAQP